MALLRKWSYKSHSYLPYQIPDNWHVLLYSDDMNATCNCAACGKKIKFGDGYSSLVIHTPFGMGYTVCHECNEKEVEEMYREKYAKR